MTLTPQTSLDERYLLLRRLAFGGMGEVWEGSDVVLDRPVAVKILRAELADDDAFRRRFRAEARTAGRVPHPGIAAVFDYGETDVAGKGLAYLVMELVPGEALSAILAREGALGTDRTLDVVAQAARALHAAHERGVIHRDVKPANLMVTPDGRVKVTDFGIARPDDHEPLTATGQVMGTAHYLAPELARGRAATPASDIYALGVVMYECLAGRRPFEGDDQIGVATAHLSEEPPPLPGTIQPEVRALVAAAMEKEPQRRMASAEALASAAEGLRLRGRAGAVPGFATAPTAYNQPPVPSSPPLGAAGAVGLLGEPVRGGYDYASGGFAAAGSGSLPAPGTPGSGPLLGPGTGATRYERPPTAPLPIVGGTGGLRRPTRRVASLPLLALVALVVALVIGTLVVTLHPAGTGAQQQQPNQTTPVPAASVTHRPTRQPTSAGRPTSTDAQGPVVVVPPPSTRAVPRTNPPSRTRTTRPTSSPSVTTSPTPTATATTPTASASTPTPTDTASASPSAPAAAALGLGDPSVGGH